jgi:hypothetical protein
MRNRPKPNHRELTPRQRAVLLYGNSAGLTGRGFLNEAEELAAWMAHRAELLAAAGSAGRPAGYFRFELCEATPEWIGDLQVLFDRGFLQAPHETATMAADQASDLHQEFASPESIRALQLPTPTLEGMAREFGLVVAHMRYLRRPALVEKYSGIHAALRTVLRETLIPLIPPKKETIQ